MNFNLGHQYTLNSDLEAIKPQLIVDYYSDNRLHFKSSMPKVADEFYTHDYWQERLELFKQQQAVTAFRCFIRCQKDFVGHIFIDNIIKGPFMAGFLGYGIAANYQGQGLMTQSLNHVTHYMFEEFKLNRVMANCMPTNTRSIKLLNAAGFEREGFARRYLKINGQWEDHLQFSCINPCL